MASSIAKVGPEWELAMQRLAQRDGIIELSHHDPKARHEDRRVIENSDGSFTLSGNNVYRVRIFAVEPECLVVERPWSPTQTIHIPVDTVLEALVVDSDKRWTFQCRVVEQLRYPLNDSKTVIALRVTRPDRVEDGQRRDYFRVHTAGAALPAAHLWHLVDLEGCVEYESYCRRRHATTPAERLQLAGPDRPMLGEDFDVTITDVSGGGLGVLAQRDISWLLPTNPLIWTKLVLPNLDEPLYLVSRIAHWRDESDELLRLGLSFTFEHHPDYRDFIVDQLCRFSADYQRQLLKRKR